MKKRLLLDCDEVIVDSGFMKLINEYLGTNYKLEDYTEYYIDKLLIPEDKLDGFAVYIRDRNFYEDPIIMKDAVRVLEKLSKKYDIYVCSACVSPLNVEGSGRKFKDKYEFLLKYFPFLDPYKFIFTCSKNVFKVDIQIDDRYCNMDDKECLNILFPSYHNKDIDEEELKKRNIIRAGLDEDNAWNVIEEMLLKDN